MGGLEQELSLFPPGKKNVGKAWFLRVEAGGACCLWFQGTDCPDYLTQSSWDHGIAPGLLQVALVWGSSCPNLLIGICWVHCSGLDS